jgi:hypothetical protein
MYKKTCPFTAADTLRVFSGYLRKPSAFSIAALKAFSFQHSCFESLQFTVFSIAALKAMWSSQGPKRCRPKSMPRKTGLARTVFICSYTLYTAKRSAKRFALLRV